MTMGIVLVACLAARIADEVYDDKDIDLELHEFGHKAWDPVQLSLSVAILNQDVFPLDITEISQPLPECLDLRPGIVGVSSPDTYPIRGIFAGCCASTANAKSQEQSAESNTKIVFLH